MQNDTMKTKKASKEKSSVIKRSHKKKVPGFSGTVHALEPMFPKRSHTKKPPVDILKSSNIDIQGGITKELDKNLVIIDLYQRLVEKQKELIELFQNVI